MRAYVINLKNRVDRWDSVLAQADKLHISIVRIEAVNTNSLSGSDSYVADGVAATWKSHQLAMSNFLDSGDSHGLILEDDFFLSRNWDVKVLDLVLKVDPDFFQIGYLTTSPLDRIDLLLQNLYDRFLKILSKMCKISSFLEKRIGHRLLIREQRELDWRIVPNDVRAGGQAYVVSRNFALASKVMNDPSFTSADGMFMSLGDVRTFKMFRFCNSLINQTDSLTSVQQRYL